MLTSFSNTIINQDIQKEVDRLELLNTPGSSRRRLRSGGKVRAWTFAAHHASRAVVYLDKPFSDEDDRHPEVASRSLSPEMTYLNQECFSLLSRLPEREKRILILRLGLDGNDPKRFDEIALEVGLSREMVRQIENTALRKLRELARSGGVGSLSALRVAK